MTEPVIDMGLHRNRLRIASHNDQSSDYGSGNGGGGNMEARVAKLESDAEYIKRDIHEIKERLKDIRSDAKTDFRMLFGAIIAVALGLAGLMAKGFGWL